MIHRDVKTSRKQKVFLATPAYSGVEAGYAFALFESVKALESAGISSELALFANDCHVDDSRNRLVRQFLMTDCTDLIFLDSDLRWEAKDLVKLCQFEVDVVGATYPLKQEKEDYPVRVLGEAENGLYEAEALPTGFLRIRRHVLETLSKEAPQYFGKADNNIPTPLIFERTLEGSQRWGGDYSFCRKWAKHGKLYLYPDPTFEHIGSRIWEGSYKHFKRVQDVGALVAGLESIRMGDDNATALKAMCVEWGNDWAGDTDLISACAMLSKGKKVLECGSGLTTLALLAAGATEVTCLEHSLEWANYTDSKAKELLTEEEYSRLLIKVVNIKDGWYDYSDFPYVDLVLCDGPPRQLSDRSQVSKVLPYLNGPLVMDDYQPNDIPMNWHRLTERVSIGYSS